MKFQISKDRNDYLDGDEMTNLGGKNCQIVFTSNMHSM